MVIKTFRDIVDRQKSVEKLEEMKKYIEKRIQELQEQIEKEKEWSDKTIYEVPNVVGMTKKEAKKALENFTVEYAGTGDKVVSQSPEAGTRVEEKTVVRLLLK